MTLSAKATRKLNEMAQTLPHKTHQTAQDYRKPIRTFIEMYRSSDSRSLHPDLVREWAIDNGWDEADARDLGEMAATVRHTLDEIGSPSG